MTKIRCSAKVSDYSGWHSYPCEKPAKVECNGKWYCTIHDPEYIKRKAAERTAKYDKELAEHRKERELDRLAHIIFEGFKNTTIADNTDTIRKFIKTLED